MPLERMVKFKNKSVQKKARTLAGMGRKTVPNYIVYPMMPHVHIILFLRPLRTTTIQLSPLATMGRRKKLTASVNERMSAMWLGTVISIKKVNI